MPELRSLHLVVNTITIVHVDALVNDPNSVTDNVSFRNIISNVFVPIAVLTLCLTNMYLYIFLFSNAT